MWGNQFLNISALKQQKKEKYESIFGMLSSKELLRECKVVCGFPRCSEWTGNGYKQSLDNRVAISVAIPGSSVIDTTAYNSNGL